MFCDITWGAGGSTADLTLDIATKMQNMVRSSRLHGAVARDARCPQRMPHAAAALSPPGCAPQICVETMMHLTCTNMPRESLKTALDKARADIWGRTCALTLVSALTCNTAAGQVGGHSEHSGAARRPAQGQHHVRGC